MTHALAPTGLSRVGLAALAATLLAGGVAADENYDLVLRGGRVVDGSGNPWFVGDVAIRGGRVIGVGRIGDAGAQRVIDARGLVVAPGFIDVHTHVENSLRRRPSADNFVFDGVTSIVTGNCGGSDVDVARLFGELGAAGLAVNLATLIGHNSVRRSVMGSEERAPSSGELERMQGLVAQAMQDGAVGLSTGLVYVPGTYATTDEVVALARTAAAHGGVYVSHIRNEGEQLLAAVEEAIGIGRAASIPVQISHFKVAHKALWKRSDLSLALVERARAEGVDVTLDQYPYAASSTGLAPLLPSWALAGGSDAMRTRLAEAATRQRIAAEMEQTIRRRNGRKRLDFAVVAGCEWDRSLEGKSISEINRQRGRKGSLAQEIGTVLEMVEKGDVQMIYHSMHERDVERILSYPYAMVASDSGVIEPGEAKPHPRGYGTNARVLARYVRERRTLRLEDAIRKMTSLPAQRFGFSDRGLLRPGHWADLVVFDAASVADRATFEQPHAASTGFRYVLVNGEIVAEEGRLTSARPGRTLQGAGARRSGAASNAQP